MWYKVKELYGKGLSKSQIAREVNIHRKTVRHYLEMTEEEFHNHIVKRQTQPRKLAPYFNFVLQQLERYPFLSAAQIEDRLKEHFPDLPSIHPKTVYNFVDAVRKANGISKPGILRHREYEKLPVTGYGQEAQVDFGVSNMAKNGGGFQKVWFFVMVLCRSRQKYIYMQPCPFTTDTTVYAHQMAFQYFGGVPRRIIYDQDRVLVVDENLGDLLLTAKFSHYVRTESFEAVFCRKADPESKGKVENVVKYVKYNFLRGREFTSADALNSAAIDWLKRTGNGKKHATTHLVPHTEWLEEKKHLLPVKAEPKQQKEKLTEYKVLKDNTVSFKGNFYSLPSGTYKGTGSKVWISSSEGLLAIYGSEKEHITTHAISILKGRYIRHTDHGRDKSVNIGERTANALALLGNTEKAELFIKGISADKPRYLNDNLRAIVSGTVGKDAKAIEQALHFCLENRLYNAHRFTELAAHYQKKEHVTETAPQGSYQLPEQALAAPSKSKINTYEKIMN